MNKYNYFFEEQKTCKNNCEKILRINTFYFSGIVSDSFKTLNEGQKVAFELGNGAKGEQAINVTVIE